MTHGLWRIAALSHCRLTTSRFNWFAAGSGAPSHCLPQGSGQGTVDGQTSTLEAVGRGFRHRSLSGWGRARLMDSFSFRNSSGSLAMFASIRRASSRVSSFAARTPARLILEIDIGQFLPGVVLHDEAGVHFLDGPGRREAGAGIGGSHTGKRRLIGVAPTTIRSGRLR